jgi:hypothetical protein
MQANKNRNRGRRNERRSAEKDTIKSKSNTDPVKEGQHIVNAKPKEPQSGEPGPNGGSTLQQLSEAKYVSVQDTALREINEADGAITSDVNFSQDALKANIHSSLTTLSVFSNPKIIGNSTVRDYGNFSSHRHSDYQVPGVAIDKFKSYLQGWAHVDGEITFTFTWSQSPMEYGERWYYFVPGGDASTYRYNHFNPVAISLLPHVICDFSASGTASLTVKRPPGIPVFDLVNNHDFGWGSLIHWDFPGTMGKELNAYSQVSIQVSVHWDKIEVTDPTPRVMHAINTRNPPVVSGIIVDENGMSVPYCFNRRMKGRTDTQDRMVSASEAAPLSRFGRGKMSSDCIFLAPEATQDPPHYGEPYMARCVLAYGTKQYLPEDPLFEELVNKIFDYHESLLSPESLELVEYHMNDRIVSLTAAAGMAGNLVQRYEDAQSLFSSASSFVPPSWSGPSDPGTSASTASASTTSVQDRSTQQDVKKEYEPGVMLESHDQLGTSKGGVNSLPELLGKEFLSFWKAVDLSATNIKGVNPTYQTNSNESVIKIMEFPANFDLWTVNIPHSKGYVSKHNDGTWPSGTDVYCCSPWAAYSSNFAESHARVHLRLKFIKTKYHNFKVRLLYSPVGANPAAGDVDPSRVDVQEFSLSDSNEIRWDQPPAFSANGYDARFSLKIQIYNARVTQAVNPYIFLQGFLKYSEFKVRSFQDMRSIPFAFTHEYGNIPSVRSDSSTVTVDGQLHTLSSRRYVNEITTIFSGGKHRVVSAIENQGIFDKEKFKNIQTAYEASPNLFAIAAEILDNAVAPDAATIGEMLIKWSILLKVARAISQSIGKKLSNYARTRFVDKMIRANLSFGEIVDYLERQIPVSVTFAHIYDTVEDQCQTFQRYGYTSPDDSGETSSLRLLPGRLQSLYHTPDGAHMTLTWAEWFAPLFWANQGAWQVRYQPADPSAIRGTYLGRGTTSSCAPNAYFLSTVPDERHLTAGDSLQTRGTPVYLRVPFTGVQPIIHSIDTTRYQHEKSSTTGRGETIQPIDFAMLHLEDTQAISGEIHIKADRQFQFMGYLGWADWCKNEDIAFVMHNKASEPTIGYPAFSIEDFSSRNKFAA